MLRTMTAKGQITIPVEIRKKLGLHNGDKINFVFKKDKTVEIVPIGVSVRSLKGMVPRPKRAISVEKMDKVIMAYHARH